jgi:RNA polymerase sigma-70 factor (ECF subfamily)
MNEVIAIKNNSETAFVNVYNQFHAKVYRFFLKRMNEHETARELTQQTYIKLWQSRHTLSELYSIETQLTTIAGSILVDHIRKEASEFKLRATLASTMATQPFLTEVFPARVFENRDYLNAAIEQLPPVRKKIIRLRIINGLTNKEIAGLLDISDKTVEDHITKAVKYVRSIVTAFILLTLLALHG